MKLRDAALACGLCALLGGPYVDAGHSSADHFDSTPYIALRHLGGHEPHTAPGSSERWGAPPPAVQYAVSVGTTNTAPLRDLLARASSS